MRLRHESLAAASRAAMDIEASRATLREVGDTAADGGSSEMSPPLPAFLVSEAGGSAVGGNAAASVEAMQRLSVRGNPGSEEWLEEVRYVISSWLCFFVIFSLFHANIHL